MTPYSPNSTSGLKSKSLIVPISILVGYLSIFFSSLGAEPVVPAGLGPVSANQPNRDSAVFIGNLLRTGGQFPTVKIVWGDEDRGSNASALSTWDNTVIISTNQSVGAFSTAITFVAG